MAQQTDTVRTTDARPKRKIRMLSSGIVPVYDHPERGRIFLLLRCYNYWDFPKGGVNKGEEPIDAALRELKEETTLESADFKWGKSFRETPAYAGGKVARYYVGLVDRTDVDLPVNPLLGRAEHHEFRWVTAKEAHALLNARVRPILEWALAQIEAPASK